MSTAAAASPAYLAETKQPWVIATVAAVGALAFVSVALRMLARWVKKAPLGLDDYFILLSMGWFLVVIGFISGMTHYGMGRHVEAVGMSNTIMVAKFLLVAELLYVVNLVWTKLSLLFLYYRIFALPTFRIWAYIIGAFVIAWVITIIFVFLFICVPVQKVWDPTLPGHCSNQVGTWAANAASTIITDIAILVLPIPHVLKLQLGQFQRWSVILAFALGFFVVFTSIYRFTVLFTYSSSDPPWSLAKTVGWTAIEISAGIVSACLPTLRPAVRWIMQALHLPTSFVSGNMDTTTNSQHGLSKLSRTGGEADFIVTTGGDSRTGRPFKRLDDDSKFRPAHGFTSTISTTSRAVNPKADDLEYGSESGDEIPLQQIRVTTDIKQNQRSM